MDKTQKELKETFEDIETSDLFYDEMRYRANKDIPVPMKWRDRYYRAARAPYQKGRSK